MQLSTISLALRQRQGGAVAAWVNPYPEIVAASSSYTNGRDTSYVNTAAIGNAFALAVANKLLIYKRTSDPFGELYDSIPAPAYQASAYSAQQAAGTMPGTPTFDTIAADYFYYPTKFKNRAAGELAPDLNVVGVSNPNWIAPEVWQLTNANVSANSVTGPDGSTANAMTFTTTGANANAFIYHNMPLGRWTITVDMKADAAISVDIGISATGNVTKSITTSWQTFSVTKELTADSTNNDFLHVFRNAPTGHTISIANLRVIPGGAAGSASAFNRNGTLLGSGNKYGDINQNGLFITNRPDTSSAQRGNFTIPWVNGVGASQSSMSVVAAINMTGAHSSTFIEPIVSAYPESGSDYQGVFFAGAAAQDQLCAGGTTLNGVTTNSCSLKGANWIIFTAICSGTQSEIWLNDFKVWDSNTPWKAGTTAPWTPSVHRALQIFMSGTSDLRSLNADLCSLTIWNSALSSVDRASAYAEAKARIVAHGATHTKPSTILITEGDSITQPGSNIWSCLVGRQSHYSPTLQGSDFAIASASKGLTTDTGTTNTVWRRLVPLRQKVADALDAGYKVIIAQNIGANDIVSTMLSDYQDSTNGIQKYYQALKATTYGGVSYSAPANVKLVGSTVAPQKTVAQGGTLTPTLETQRTSTNTYIKTLTSDANAFVDWDAVFGGVWSSGNFTDNVHPNSTGQGLIRDAADTAIFPFWTA